VPDRQSTSIMIGTNTSGEKPKYCEEAHMRACRLVDNQDVTEVLLRRVYNVIETDFFLWQIFFS
jgi:hypothetical protein